jgi:hypothetical protein
VNTHFPRPEVSATTQTDKGLLRRRWSVAEIEAMVRAGVNSEDARFELIGREIVPMADTGAKYEIFKVSLLEFWVDRKCKSLKLAIEFTFEMDENALLEPDFYSYNGTIKLLELSPSNALLAVEIADSSLACDRGARPLSISTSACGSYGLSMRTRSRPASSSSRALMVIESLRLFIWQRF